MTLLPIKVKYFQIMKDCGRHTGLNNLHDQKILADCEIGIASAKKA